MSSPPNSRNPWPIAIITLFVVFGAFIATFIVFAVGQKQELVAENYYENEVRFQEQLDRVSRTRLIAPQAAVNFDASKNCILVSLPAAQTKGASGKIRFYRPSNSKLDHEVPLALNDQGIQTLDAKALTAGLWKIRVEWTANGLEYYFDQSVVVSTTPASGSARSPRAATTTPNQSAALL